MDANLKAYAIRQISTGLYIPRLETGRRRGGSSLEFSDEREPRLFHNKNSARRFLSNWLKGVYTRKFDNNGDDYLVIIHRVDRNKEDVEIVEFNLKENK